MKPLKKIFFAALVTVFLAGCAAQTHYLRLDPLLNSSIRTLDGYQYVPLIRLCDVYGISYDWDTFTKTASLRVGSSSIVLRSGSQGVLVDGIERKLDRPVLVTEGAVFVPVSFARNTIVPIVSAGTEAPEKTPAVEEQKKFTIRTIALDAGHGGKDAGAIGRSGDTKEKDVALGLAKRVKGLLEDAGLKVVMIRNDDTFFALPKRTGMANDSGAEVFVSIHINASRSRAVRGFECYYLSSATDDNARALEAFENSSLKLSDNANIQHSQRLDKTLWDMMLTENRKESAELAGMICQSVDESQLTTNNGVKTARFYVLKHINIPSVLVEAGYISNRAEEMKLKNPQFLDKMAGAIVRGILKYKKRYEATEGFTDV